MKILLKSVLVVVIMLGGLFGRVAEAQQTPANTMCTEESGLSFNLNSESDMDKYRVYASNNPIDINVDNSGSILMEIIHDPSAAVDGKIHQTLNTTLSEGPKYFRVTAVDTKSAESGYSNEIGCEYNLIPGIPTGITIILKLSS